MEWWLRDHFQTPESPLPVPPAKLRFKVGECNEIAVFRAVGEQTARNIESALSAAGYCLRDFRSVLDFGCGGGRTLVWLRDLAPEVE